MIGWKRAGKHVPRKGVSRPRTDTALRAATPGPRWRTDGTPDSNEPRFILVACMLRSVGCSKLALRDAAVCKGPTQRGSYGRGPST
jgi:hypothetical protein